MWNDFLSVREAEFTNKVLDELRAVAWARPLLDRLEMSGGLTASNMPLLFEARVAYELHRAERTAEYEFPTGVGESSVDFRVQGSPEWLIEVVSVSESKAVQKATIQASALSMMRLSTLSEDARQSEEGELILLQQKIGEKVVRRDGSPIKFPEPGEAIHAILVDARGFLGVGSGDPYDYDHATQGAAGLPDFAVRYWDDQPIRGLFEKDNRLRAAQLIQSRIHFIVFAREREYRDGELPQRTYACPNPRLFRDGDAARVAYRSFPLRPTG